MKAMNMKKRIASTALAGAMALSLAAPAFAAAGNETVISGTYTPITLAVTVPTTGKAVINPYGLPYTLGEATISGQQITTGAPLTILNKSAVGLKVGAKITSEASTGVTLEASASGYDQETDKKMVVKFQAFTADTVAGDSATDTAFLNNAFAALKDSDAVMQAVLDTSQAVTATKVTGKDDLVLREGSADGAVQKGGAAFFRLSGEVAQGASWEKTDTFKATVAFTFTPTAYTKPAGTLTSAAQSIKIGAASGGDKTTVTLALSLPEKVTPKKVTWEAPDNFKVTDQSTLTGGTPVIKAQLEAVKVTSSAQKITVKVLGSDGITYSATTATDNAIEVEAAD